MTEAQKELQKDLGKVKVNIAFIWSEGVKMKKVKVISNKELILTISGLIKGWSDYTRFHCSLLYREVVLLRGSLIRQVSL